MPFVDPMTQAIRDFTGGLTHRDANPYTVDSRPAQEWVEAMLVLEAEYRALPQEPEVQAA